MDITPWYGLLKVNAIIQIGTSTVAVAIANAAINALGLDRWTKPTVI